MAILAIFKLIRSVLISGEIFSFLAFLEFDNLVLQASQLQLVS